MKNNSLTFLTLSFVTAFLFSITSGVRAQNISLDSAQIVIEDEGSVDAITLVTDIQIDEFRELFDDYMKKYQDVNMNMGGLFGKHRIARAEEARIESVSTDLINFYARFIEKGADTELSIYANFNEDLPITGSQYPEEYQKLYSLLSNFAEVSIPEFYNQQIASTRDEIEDLSRDINNLKEKMERNKKRIKDLEKENLDLETEISNFEKDLEEKKGLLSERKQMKSEIDANIRRSVTKNRK